MLRPQPNSFAARSVQGSARHIPSGAHASGAPGSPDPRWSQRGGGSRRASDAAPTDGSRDPARTPGIVDSTATAPPTHWLGALGPAHYVARIERDGLAYCGQAECGVAVRGARPVFRGEAHPRCGACIGRLIDGIGAIPD